MYAWGRAESVQIGVDLVTEPETVKPREVPLNGIASIKTVACANKHTIFVTDNGTVLSVGSNDMSQLGRESSAGAREIDKNLSNSSIHQLACGPTHSLALSAWGMLYGWGLDSRGQLGTGSSKNIIPKPTLIKSVAFLEIAQVASGHDFCLALTRSGETYAWGCNIDGQLGIGKDDVQLVKPAEIQEFVGVPIALIATGAHHSFALTTSGAVYGWGCNGCGQLGLNDNVNRYVPCELKTLRSVKIKYIACGEEFSAFLSSDGGVFTCGLGSDGQLGHGSTSSEYLPRKVPELMGSTVSQIACGRAHTLVFVSSSRKVYSFGCGTNGQLGISICVNVDTPRTVIGPWLDDYDKTMSVHKCYIKGIYAGGDVSIATVSSDCAEAACLDYRVRSRTSRILTIDLTILEKCVVLKNTDVADQDLLSFIETVFSSLSCLNGSFLVAGHYNCSIKDPGVDLEYMRNCFNTVSKISNECLHDLIFNSIVTNIIPAMSKQPVDVEGLRVYLTLPYYHEFEDPTHFKKLQNPFAVRFQDAPHSSAEVIRAWWMNVSATLFARLIRIYKQVVVHVLASESPEIVYLTPDLMIPLDMLMYLYKMNTSNKNGTLIVAHEAFHIPELNEIVQLDHDYAQWRHYRQRGRGGRIFLCSYPFLFDAKAKIKVLQTDQAIQMHSAVSEAANLVFTSMLFSPERASSITPHLELNVRRSAIVIDAINQLSSVHPSDLKKPLKVKFIGEEAEDAGGVKKEFFMLLLKEILDPKYGMFREYEETRTIWFTEESFEEKDMYYLIGIVCGLAIYNFTIIPLPFPLALYKKLLKEPVVLEDLKELSPILAKSLQDLLDYSETDVEEVFCLTFEITREVYGEVKSYSLIPNGGNIPVTHTNKEQYVTLYVDFIFNRSVQNQFEAFAAGFYKVCEGKILEIFQAHELMAAVIGNENYDWDEWQACADYKNGYSASDPTIRYFWEVFRELPLEYKKKFLVFLTGCDRIPLQGMRDIRITIQPVNNENALPVAHTCFNLLDLPRYKTKQKLRDKLLLAIEHNQGFTLV